MNCTEPRATHNSPALGTKPVEGRLMRDKVKDAATNNPVDLDRRLDLALEETFPASEPVSVMCC